MEVEPHFSGVMSSEELICAAQDGKLDAIKNLVLGIVK